MGFDHYICLDMPESTGWNLFAHVVLSLGNNVSDKCIVLLFVFAINAKDS